MWSAIDFLLGKEGLVWRKGSGFCLARVAACRENREGSFGKVYKAQRTERGRTFYSAIKIISIPGNKGELDSVRSEMNDEQSTREYFRNLVEDCVQEIYTMEHFCGNSHVVSFEDFKWWNIWMRSAGTFP